MNAYPSSKLTISGHLAHRARDKDTPSHDACPWFRLRPLGLPCLVSLWSSWVGKAPKRWVVERTHSWMNRYRRLLIRWEKQDALYVGSIYLAFCCLILERLIDLFLGYALDICKLLTTLYSFLWCLKRFVLNKSFCYNKLNFLWKCVLTYVYTYSA